VTIMKKRLAGILFTSAAVAGALALRVSPASADTTINLTYPVSGSTYINAIHSSIPLGPGTLSATADLTTAR
jgi:ABC-type sugar transport system substrate-binding protein